MNQVVTMLTTSDPVFITLLTGLITVGFLPWILPPPRKTKATDFSAMKAILRRLRPAAPLPLGTLVVEISSRLQAGASVRQAWSATLNRYQLSDLTPSHDPYLPGSELIRILSPTLPADQLSSLRGLSAAVDFSAEAGAPLNQVLEQCVKTISDSAEAARARRIAFTAPQVSARILAVLPLAGLGLGALLGTRPLQVLFDGGLGTICGLLGVIFLTAGLLWTNRLLQQAQRA